MSDGLTVLPEYPGLLIPITETELSGWTALMDMAGKKREGKYHAPMEWMVHASLVRTNGEAVINADENYLGNGHHLRRMGDFFFNLPDSIFRVEWNPHSVLIIDEFFQSKFISLLGSASAGKSYTMAILGVLMFMVNPRFTKVLVTCTTMQAGKGKIWGDICNAWNQIEAVFAAWGLKVPGKLMSDPTMVRYHCPVYDPAKGWITSFTSHKAGLELIATLQSSEKQAVASVQGYKNETVIFLGDEWDSFSPALADTVTGNLAANPNAHCIASLNISGRNSAGGLICTPEGGWDTVDPSMDRWMGVHGPVLRFDATKSPNVIAGYEMWKGLPTKEYVDHETEKYGEDSIGYWMYVRAWPPPTGESRFIYSEMELTVQYLCDHKVTTWLSMPTRIAACDPSFVHGGDGAMLMILNVGQAQINGQTVTVCELHRAIDLEKFISADGMEKDKQVVLLIKRFMSDPEVGFELKNLAVDITGATSFGTLINEIVGKGWIPISSGARPSERPISKADTRKGCDVYEDLLTEMWLAPKALVRAGQLRGLDAETRREMCMRCYEERGKQRGLVEVESKRIMKKRNRKMSPNRADALFIGIHVARMNHGLVSVLSQGGLKKKPDVPMSPMQKFYADNPALKPKVPKWRRPVIQQLKSSHVPW